VPCRAVGSAGTPGVDARLAPLDGRSQAARGDHAGEPVEVLREGRQARQADRAGDPSAEQRGAREGVGTAPRQPPKHAPGDGVGACSLDP
jgi:hypothetical protein